MSQADLELGVSVRGADLSASEPFLNYIENDDLDVELRYPVDDPIYGDFKRGDERYLQVLIERLHLYEGDDVDQAVSHLRREILLSDANRLDAEDEGGISIYAVKESLSAEEAMEYEEPMCLFERLLWTLIQIKYKDEQSTDVVELVLVKSRKDYEKENRRVPLLLKQYDEMLEPSVKYLQWQIFSGKAEKYVKKILEIQENISKNSESSLIATKNESSQSSDSLETDEKEFQDALEIAINNPHHLDELFEAVFPSGSLELLKYLLAKIKEKKLREQLVCPILVNAVYWSIYVKIENLKNFYKCFNCALEVEKKNLAAKDSRYGDTALHIANDFRDKYMIRELLNRHPPIAVKNNKGSFPISNIPKDVLKNFLDSIITDIPTIFLNSIEVWKIIKGIYIREYQLENVIFIDFNTFVSTNSEDNSKEFNDIELIKQITDSKELWELVDHPVISTLLELHWNQLKFEIIIDQYFCILVALLTYSLIFFFNLLFKKFLTVYSDYLIIIVTLILIVLELINNRIVFVKTFIFLKKSMRFLCKKVVQKLSTKRKEIKGSTDQIDNTNTYETESLYEEPEISQNKSLRKYGTLFSFVLTLPLLILICLYGFKGCFENVENCKETYGIGIIFLSLNVSLLIGYFSRNIAINLIMLFYVASTGAKFIFSTFLILLGFAFSLTTLIKDYGLPKDDEAQSLYTFQQCANINKTAFELSEYNNENNETLSKHSMFGLGIFKTIIMSTGEFEAGGLIFPYFSSYFVFICFVFTIPIVFINLLNALAIEDVQKIKKEAMIWYRKVQIMFLYEYTILHKSIFKLERIFCRKTKKYFTTIYPNKIGERAFIGIRTTTKEIFSMSDVDEHEKIGYLPQDVVDNALSGLNYRQNI